jgi:hypothetical protein
MNDRLTTVLHEQASGLDVQLTNPGQLRRAAQRKRAVRRSLTATVAAAAAVVVAVFAGTSALSGGDHHAVPVGPSPHPTRFAGVPAAGTPASLPEEGRLLVNVTTESGAEFNVYADGRIVWQRWSSAGSGNPLVVPDGADPSETTYVQQRLTPAGAQLLWSRILAIGLAAGLFGHSVSLGNEAFEADQVASWYQVCNKGQLNHAQVVPPSYLQDPSHLETPAQVRALAQITSLAADPGSLVPASAWADRTVRPFVPSHYLLVFDRHAPDPAKLPSPAKDVLAQFQPLLRDADQTVTTDQARALITAFAASGVKVADNNASNLGFDVPAVGEGNRTILKFRPDPPSSALTDRDQC